MVATQFCITATQFAICVAIPLRKKEKVNYALERKADKKKEKYSKQQLPGGIIATVTPLVMEHFEAWGSMGGNSCANYQRSHRTKWDD